MRGLWHARFSHATRLSGKVTGQKSSVKDARAVALKTPQVG